MQEAPIDRATIRKEAAQWTIRLAGDPLDAAERSALDEWCARSPAHAAELEAAKTTWTDLGSIGSLSPFAQETPEIHPAKPTAAPRGRSAVYRAAAAAMLVLAVLSATVLPDQMLRWQADYATAVGEIRTVSLPDGSTVMLNTQSAISVDFTGKARNVTLLQGEAVFTVVPTEKDPFTVSAANGKTQALGTRFLVERHGEQVNVTALEHRVSIKGKSGQSIIISPGDALTYHADGALGEVYDVTVSSVAPWQNGQLVFKNRTLEQVVSALNRYVPERILILEQDLAAREVSGVFLIDKLDGAVPFIARQLGAGHAKIPSVAIVLY